MTSVSWARRWLSEGRARRPCSSRTSRWNAKEDSRLCNLVFLDGHAAAVPGAKLPHQSDNIYLPVNLTTATLWDVKLAVSSAH